MGNTFSCKICMKSKSKKSKRFDNNKSCKHSFCKDCIAQYVISKVGDDTPDIECPEPDCHVPLDPSSCKLLLSMPVYTRWHDLIRQFNADIADTNASGTLNPDIDSDFALLMLSRQLQRCPSCKHFVERASGCNIVVCRCGTKFCYKCGGPMHQFTHTSKGPCIRKEKILFNK